MTGGHTFGIGPPCRLATTIHLACVARDKHGPSSSALSRPRTQNPTRPSKHNRRRRSCVGTSIWAACSNAAISICRETCALLAAQMRLLGSTALEEEGADDRTPVPMDFLMEVMETRESLEKSSSQDEVEAISAETTAAINECLQDMDEALKAGGGKEELSDAAVRLRYLYRIQKEAQRVLHGLEDSRASPDAGSA